MGMGSTGAASASTTVGNAVGVDGGGSVGRGATVGNGVEVASGGEVGSSVADTGCVTGGAKVATGKGVAAGMSVTVGRLGGKAIGSARPPSVQAATKASKRDKEKVSRVRICWLHFRLVMHGPHDQVVNPQFFGIRLTQELTVTAQVNVGCG